MKPKPYTIRTLPLSSLLPAPGRRTMGEGTLKGFRGSLRRYGPQSLPVWNERTGRLVDGHKLVDALRDEGRREFPCFVVDLPPAEASALRVALNGLRGRWEPGDLEALLADVTRSAPAAARDLHIEELRVDLALDERLAVPASRRPGQLSLLADKDRDPA